MYLWLFPYFIKKYQVYGNGIGLNCGDPNIQFQNKWKGQNILGFTLMKVRDKFKNN